jgi:hypothetical protein
MAGAAVAGSVCDPVAGTFNNETAETDTNHLGESCGLWAKPIATLSSHKCTLTMNFVHPFHTAEEAWMRGAEVRGYDCHLTQVENELGAGILKFTNIGTTPSPCAAIAAQVDQLVAQAGQTQASIDGGLEFHRNVKETELCAGSTAAFNASDPDVGALRQSACQLKSLQQSVETVFLQMASCEVSTRLMYSYQKFLVAPDNKETIDQEVMAIVNGQQGNHNDCTVASIQPKYISYYQGRYMARLNQVWNDTVCK